MRPSAPRMRGWTIKAAARPVRPLRRKAGRPKRRNFMHIRDAVATKPEGERRRGPSDEGDVTGRALDVKHDRRSLSRGISSLNASDARISGRSADSAPGAPASLRVAAGAAQSRATAAPRSARRWRYACGARTSARGRSTRASRRSSAATSPLMDAWYDDRTRTHECPSSNTTSASTTRATSPGLPSRAAASSAARPASSATAAPARRPSRWGASSNTATGAGAGSAVIGPRSGCKGSRAPRGRWTRVSRVGAPDSEPVHS